MIRRPPRSTLDRSSAASDVYKRQAVKYAMKHTMPPNGKWTPDELLGKRIKVLWTQKGDKGLWPGTIIDHVRNKTSFWVKYDQPSKDGTTTYEDDLLGSRPKWNFIEKEKHKRE